MLQQEVYEAPIVPIFIDRELEIQAYYSKADSIASRTDGYQYPTAQSPYPPYHGSYPYPTENYPQGYPNLPNMPSPYQPPPSQPYNQNENPYSYHNPYPGQTPTPYHNTNQGYQYPYPVGYSQYNYQYPYNPNQPPQGHPYPQAPGMGSTMPGQWAGQGQPYPPTNSPYPQYQSGAPGYQNNVTAPLGWGDLVLPLEPYPTNPACYQDRSGATNRDFVAEDTIYASEAKKDFNENTALYHEIEIGWKI